MRYNNTDPCELYPGITIAREIPPAGVGTAISGENAMQNRFSRQLEDTDYIVYLNLLGKDQEDVARMHRLVTGWARPMDRVTHELVPTHWQTVAYNAACADISIQQKSWTHWIICIVFRLFRGIAHDRIPTTADTGGAAGTLNIYVDGTSYIRPEIRLTAAAAADSITLYVDEKPYFRLVAPLAAGDAVTIRNDDGVDLYTAATDTTQDAADKMDYVTTDTHAMWEALTPGPHAIRSDPAAAIEMEWRNEWV